MHVLVIEDEPLVAWVIREALLDLGFSSCDVALDGEQAAAAYSRKQPDLICADCRMPGGANGIEIALELIGDTSTPLIAITGTTHLVGLSPDLVVAKPFTDSDIRRAILAAGIQLPADRAADRAMEPRASQSAAF
jgi:CheY-like chemotaxis protein